ncbi:methylated-DNA--[protein]-cysteine S-methyltransferase [Natribacillus halophilus]|uniref:Methylated-DNA--protein-cysteine methyltransferase n=1 Tax=Natribacillus halophilus TaxID=549003 RepID=A0A1G8NT54_9BACI|nr:methylated-DNA--[protein]-cysteine S-methyltransferase [Natribacillus halophilus]SDI83368.1 methylated-DNA-[protein]-cysteine S-methyltransferase [Natribacillus halophilus]
MQTIKFTEMESPVGIITLVATENGLCQLLFGDYRETNVKIRAWMAKRNIRGELQHDDDYFFDVREQLQEYFQGERQAFNLPIDIHGTSFQKHVWEALRHIPYGETQSYKQVATTLRAPKAVRAVGNANNQNPLPIIIPCHRVIGSNGAFVGYGGGIEKKKKLLALEGA